ncbi:MAG: sulfate adenylyltransferase subunit CysN [Rhodobacteraceae bacterium]|nr:sulfate adenylyltransferase subunit CysN [Paracoccaceae bacterium]
MSSNAGPGAATHEIGTVLARQDVKDQLRFIICGSVDDGKSTLLGRLLYDSRNIFDDQISAAESESRVYGTQGDSVDLALLLDGLQAEREQGITIDVAYRYFETPKRKFIAIDAPGHEQYTRNMATGASNADVALVLVDARNGVVTQTRRHSHIIALMGIRRVILAVNKMDLVDYDRRVYSDIVQEYKAVARDLGAEEINAVPVSALTGENVFTACGNTPWHGGPTLLELLENVEVRRDELAAAFRLPVQWVNRPNPDFRGYSGTVASGHVERGMSVVASPSGRQSTVERILGPSGDLEKAIAGQSITIVLADEIDVSRGEMIAGTDSPPEFADHFAVHLIWTDSQPMLPERSYSARFASASGIAQITDLTHRIDVNTRNRLAAKMLELNEIGYCKITLDHAIPFDPYSVNRRTGSFVLIDRFTNATVGAGVIDFALRRASNISWQEMKVDKATRARATAQTPCILWLTGLSGAGKSTIADRLEQKLQSLGRFTYLLDGDNVRHGLNKDLGFTEEDRVENIRRVAEVARLMVDAGLIVIVSFISPFRSERQMARSMVDEGEFFEIFVDTPLEVCEERDPKGLYAKARKGILANFTGIDSPYEPPEKPDLRINTTKVTADEAANDVIGFLGSKEAGFG